MSDNVMHLFGIAIFIIVAKSVYSWYFAAHPFYKYKILMVDKWFIPLYTAGYGYWYVLDIHGTMIAKEDVVSIYNGYYWFSSKFSAMRAIVAHRRNLKQEELTKKIELAKKRSIKTKYYRY